MPDSNATFCLLNHKRRLTLRRPTAATTATQLRVCLTLHYQEFADGVALLGVPMDEAAREAEFARLDCDGGGVVRFEDFCTSMARRSVRARDNDRAGFGQYYDLGVTPCGTR